MSEQMTDEQIDCILCGGTEEVEIVPHNSSKTLGRGGIYGCPACIERKLRTDLATKEAEWATLEKGCDTLIQSHKEMRLQLAAANAIVERLPMTADGVRVVGGDSVYDPDSEMELDCVLNGSDWAYEPGPHLIPVMVRLISECYSTREAAKAAREGGEG